MNKLWQRIFKRRQSYRRLFLDGDGRAHPTAEGVLADLKRFCRADTSTHMADREITQLKEENE